MVRYLSDTLYIILGLSILFFFACPPVRVYGIGLVTGFWRCIFISCSDKYFRYFTICYIMNIQICPNLSFDFLFHRSVWVYREMYNNIMIQNFLFFKISKWQNYFIFFVEKKSDKKKLKRKKQQNKAISMMLGKSMRSDVEMSKKLNFL